MPAIETAVGRMIRHHRKRKGWLIRELAEALGVTGALVSRWELGREFAPFARRAQIADALDLYPALLTEPTAVEVDAEERGLLDDFRALFPGDRAAVRSLIAESAATQRSLPC